MNKTALEGQVYVCAACGKRSHDRYGFNSIDYGWDVSCMLNAVLCYEKKDTETMYQTVAEDNDEKED